jgi:hypothetical protein
VEDALGQPLRRTDPYGKPLEEDGKTAREIIAAGAEEFLKTVVDDKGNPVKPDRYNNHKHTRMDRLMRGLIDKKFEQEMNSAIAGIKRQVEAEMRAAAAAWLAQFQSKTAETMEKIKRPVSIRRH